MESEVVRISADLVDTIRIYAEAENKAFSDMASDLLADALNKYFIERSGGAFLTLPNPQFNSELDKKKAEEFVVILNEAAAKLRELNTGISFPLERIAAFFEYRLFLDEPEQINTFRSNMLMDEDMNPKSSEDEVV